MENNNLLQPLEAPHKFWTSGSKWSIFNPTVTTRLWAVDCSDYCGGEFKNFWLKRSALKYLDSVLKSSHSWDYISLKNNWNKTSQLYYKSKRVPIVNEKGQFLGYTKPEHREYINCQIIKEN